LPDGSYSQVSSKNEAENFSTDPFTLLRESGHLSRTLLEERIAAIPGAQNLDEIDDSEVALSLFERVN
jgi:hypothetical protein